VATTAGGWGRAAGLAALTGMRTFVAPMLLWRRTVRRAPLRAGVYLLAAMELIGDKLPRMQSRTAPLGLACRVLCGAGVARALVRGGGRAGVAGATVLGVACALAGAFGGLRARLALTRRLGGGARANAIAGVIEDAALVGVGTRLLVARTS